MASSGVVPVGPRVVKRVLDVTWIVFVVGAVLAMGAIIAAVAVGAHLRVTFPVAFSVHGTLVVAGSSRPASLTQTGGRLIIQPPTGLVAEGLAFVVAMVGFGLVVLYQLRALMSDALSGTPFGKRSAQRVRLIGVAIVVVEVLRCFVVLVGSLWAQGHVNGAGLAFSGTFPLNAEVVVLGVLVVLLAEVFRHGSNLQTDHDLTI